MQLLNYSASTAVRATLLASGWSVGYGPQSGPKSTTTVAFTDPSLAQSLDMKLLGPEWLERWEKSHMKTARDLSQTSEQEFEAKIRSHRQFES